MSNQTISDCRNGLTDERENEEAYYQQMLAFHFITPLARLRLRLTSNHIDQQKKTPPNGTDHHDIRVMEKCSWAAFQ